MGLFVFALVLLSASLHVFWNTLVKKCDDKASFAWLTTAVTMAFLIPIFAFLRLVHPWSLSPELWGLSGLSGLLEALYVILLFGAYEKADLSVVYPLSRGVAPIFVLPLACWIIGDSVTLPHSMAILVIVAGVVIVSFSAQTTSKVTRGRHLTGAMLALATGAMIAGYHLVDRFARKLAVNLNALDDVTFAFQYFFIMYLFLLAFITVWICFSSHRRSGLFSEWKTNKSGIFLVSVFGAAAYFLIILALGYAQAGYIAAGRNVGVVISIAVGALLLKEHISWKRAFGAGLIILGVVALAVLES